MHRDPAGLAGQSFDVAVIGGGMHGAWIAWRAARRGSRVVLLEREDFGAGTSANSLKILHGGLRYLQQLDLPRMRRSITARREHARCYPHLFEPLPCVMPLKSTGLRSPWFVGPALLANDLIGWDRNQGVASGARLPAGGLLSAEQCFKDLRMLVPQLPYAGALWWDGVARDAERLVLEVVIAAAAAGAQVANHVQAERILHAAGKVQGVAFTDRLSGRTHELTARQVVNVTGPWAAQLVRASGLPVDGLPLHWTGALNLVLRRPLGHRAAVALSTSASGRPDLQRADATGRNARSAMRELFFVPWRGRTMIGTDYCPVESVEEGLRGPPAEVVTRFIRQAATLAPEAGIEPADVAALHWGLMPLARADDTLPRSSPVLQVDAAVTGAQGLLTLIGEKLTSAPQVSARVLAHLAPPAKAAVSAGAAAATGVAATATPPTVGDAVRARLQSRYGSRWADVARGAIGPQELEPLCAEAGVLPAELRHAVDAEMAQTLPDLLRRMGLGQTGHPGRSLIDTCAAWAITHAAWNEQSVREQAQALDDWFRARSGGVLAEQPRPFRPEG